MAQQAKKIVQINDGAGQALEFQEFDGCMFPTFFPLEALQGVPNMKLRPDDILLCNYPKSGTHWFWEILCQLSAGKAENTRDCWKGDMMIECTPPAHLQSLSSPRILNTHLPFEKLPKDLIQTKCKIVYGMRNPKDVAVSFYNHHKALKHMYKYDGEWENYLPLFIKGLVDWGSWFDNVISYKNALRHHKDLDIIFVSYEDMLQDPIGGVKKLSEFLGLHTDHQLCIDIASKCHFDNMKAVAKETGKGLIYNNEPQVFRKGRSGDWKNWFTVAQSEMFDTIFSEKMTGYSIPLYSP